MYIYIQTPPVNYSNKIPHLLEHCVHNKYDLSYNEYFDRCIIKSQTFYGYTKFDIGNRDVSDFIKSIESPINTNIIDKELSSLNEELREKIFTMKLRKIIEKKLNLNVNNRFSIHNLLSYHKNYYNKGHYVIADEKYNVVDCGITVSNPGPWDINLVEKFSKKISYEMNDIFVLRYLHWKDQIFMHFLEVLIDSWIEFNDRYVSGIYYYVCSCMIEGNGYISISIPRYDLSIPENFFVEAKKFYLKQFDNGDIRENIIINLLYLNQFPDDFEVKNFIENLGYETVLNFII